MPLVQGQCKAGGAASQVHFLYAHTLIWVLRYLDNLDAIHRPAALASPGSSLELQNLRPHPRLIESKSVFGEDPRVHPESDLLVLLLKGALLEFINWLIIKTSNKQREAQGRTQLRGEILHKA